MTEQKRPTDPQDAAWADEMARMRQDLLAWRRAHPEATMDEIVAEVTRHRREVMGDLVGELAQEPAEDDAQAEAVGCPSCGQPAEYRGEQTRQVLHFEGASTLSRSYYYCPRCERGFFPPRPTPEP
jgi:hypothetical protein